jgi:hypothetical protein
MAADFKIFRRVVTASSHTDRYSNTNQYSYTLGNVNGGKGIDAVTERLTRQEQRERNRLKLLEAAEKVFAERGVQGASLDEVAAEAGLTKGRRPRRTACSTQSGRRTSWWRSTARTGWRWRAVRLRRDSPR